MNLLWPSLIYNCYYYLNTEPENNKIIIIKLDLILLHLAFSCLSNYVREGLKKKSNLISENFDNKELDVLLSSGEQVSCSLLAGALISLGLKARSWLGWQIPIVTNNNYKFQKLDI